ncbi:hypothetical protein, partial [Frankia sp. CcWB2]
SAVPSVEPESTTTTCRHQPTDLIARMMFGASLWARMIAVRGTDPGAGCGCADPAGEGPAAPAGPVVPAVS